MRSPNASRLIGSPEEAEIRERPDNKGVRMRAVPRAWMARGRLGADAETRAPLSSRAARRKPSVLFAPLPAL